MRRCLLRMNLRTRQMNNQLNIYIMKKIILALAVLLAVQVADAQTKSPADAKKAVESAEAASQDAKKATKVATWLKLAEAYVNAYNAPAGAAWVGASKQELQLILGNEKPVSVEEVVLGGESLLKESYATRDYYFTPAGQLVMIVVTQPVYEDALGRALEAYKKAYEVDLKGSKVKDITAGLESISKKYLDEGMNSYTLGDNAKASVYFAKAAEASATAPLSRVDTTALYNAGFVAWAGQDYEAAKKYFEQCLEVGYYYEGGEVFAKLADVYGKLGDKAASVAMLERGFTAFPQSQSILIGLINYYLESGDNTDRLFELIAEAKKNEPNNASLYYVEGNIYNELRAAEKDEAKAADLLAKAVAAYDACEGINAEYEYGHIGKGVMFYNMAIELQEKAANEMDDKKYMALVEQFESALMNALDPFEKAYNISKDNGLKVSIAEYLKNVYYRFFSKGEKYEAGYKKYDEVVKTGQAN